MLLVLCRHSLYKYGAHSANAQTADVELQKAHQKCYETVLEKCLTLGEGIIQIYQLLKVSFRDILFWCMQKDLHKYTPFLHNALFYINHIPLYKELGKLIDYFGGCIITQLFWTLLESLVTPHHHSNQSVFL